MLNGRLIRGYDVQGYFLFSKIKHTVQGLIFFSYQSILTLKISTLKSQSKNTAKAPSRQQIPVQVSSLLKC